MPNIMDEYILFMEKCFHKYLKLIYGDYMIRNYLVVI